MWNMTQSGQNSSADNKLSSTAEHTMWCYTLSLRKIGPQCFGTQGWTCKWDLIQYEHRQWEFHFLFHHKSREPLSHASITFNGTLINNLLPCHFSQLFPLLITHEVFNVTDAKLPWAGQLSDKGRSKQLRYERNACERYRFLKKKHEEQRKRKHVKENLKTLCCWSYTHTHI